jgi:hypothetical protein
VLKRIRHGEEEDVHGHVSFWQRSDQCGVVLRAQGQSSLPLHMGATYFFSVSRRPAFLTSSSTRSR